jgi:hypothetical protein
MTATTTKLSLIEPGTHGCVDGPHLLAEIDATPHGDCVLLAVMSGTGRGPWETKWRRDEARQLARAIGDSTVAIMRTGRLTRDGTQRAHLSIVVSPWPSR